MVYAGDPQIRESIEKNIKNCNIIWFALFGFALIMAVSSRFAPEYLPIPTQNMEKASLKTFYYALMVVSVSELGVLFILRKVLMKPMYKLGQVPTEFQAREKYISSLFRFYTQAIAVCSAFGASIAFYGFILLYFGVSFNDVLPFYGLSVIGLFIAKPRVSDIENVLEQN